MKRITLNAQMGAVTARLRLERCQRLARKVERLASLGFRRRGLLKQVSVGAFDAACRRQVVVVDREAVGVRVVDGGGDGELGDGGVLL